MQTCNAIAGQKLSFTATIENPHLQPGDSVEINWGDSTQPSFGTMAVTTLGNSDGTVGVVTANHTYSNTAAGPHNIQITVSYGATQVMYDETVDVAVSPVAIVALSSVSNGSQLQVGYDVTSDEAASFTIAIVAHPAQRLRYTGGNL